MNGLTGLIQLDFRSSESITMQIVRQVEDQVRKGTLKHGDQLPTVRELATELRINFSTVARAYKIMDERRVISTQRGRGTYIWEEPPLDLVEERRRQSVEEMALRYLADAVGVGVSIEQAVDAVVRAAYQMKSAAGPDRKQANHPSENK